jgi:O-antigen/teichoic acid export membrane protein
VLPSFEFLLVPQAFRGPFAHYFTLLLPGLFCYAMIHWAVNPIFQIAKRTGALIAVALIASLANGLLLLILPPSSDASTYAVAQSGALGIGLAALLLFAAQLQPVWPRTRDLALTTLATLAMAATVAPLRSMTPGVAALVLQIGAGILVYAALAMLFDLSGLRSMVSRRIGRWPGLALLKKSS